MKKITLALILSINLVFSNPVDTVTAKIVATNFWKQNGVRTQNAVPKFKVEQMLFNNIYILTAIDTLGFVIVSADDRVIPILGYSDENSFDVTNIPPNLIEWLMGYEQQIQYINEENIEPSEDAVVEWNTLREGGTIVPKSVTGVNPLINTKWDQGQYYNELCPTNIFAVNSNGHTVTGCVATAMAQVMKYWNYPTHGRGYHSYHCSYYGTQSANFANTTYKWSYMPNRLIASSTTTQVNAVATLMYHCGVSVDMNYGIIEGSGINDISLVVQALKNYFKYDNALHLVSKSSCSEGVWINLLKNELNNGRPIFYVGTGSGGHAFVCDGYDNSNYFHFNWGWSGNHNGYYSVNDLSPGDYNFSSNQLAIVGIQPSTNTEPELEMYSTLNVNDAWFGSDITGSIKVLNTGINNFSGYLAVVIFNDQGIAVDDQIFTVNSLPYNYYVTKNINISGGVPLIPGAYHAYALYSEDGNNWSLVPNGTNASATTTFDINYSAQIETNSAFTPTVFTQGQSVTVNVGVKNSGSSTFYGKVRVSLANIEDGSYVQNIQVLNITNGLPANHYYTNGVNFTGTITAAPGTYVMSLAYQREGETSWYYAGSTNYQNPVFVTVVAPPTLSVSPSTISFQKSGGSRVVTVTSNVNWTANTSASWLTISSNTGTESASMIVTATANNYNSSRTATITLNGSNGVSQKTITVSQLGNSSTNILDELEETPILIFPNPTSDNLYVTAPETVIINFVEIFNEEGQRVKTINGNVSSINVSDLSIGMYFIRIHTDGVVVVRKFVKR